MIVKELLPIRSMEIPDWDKIHSGFIISGESDAPVPIENPFSGQIIKYLLNRKLDISDYTDKYDKFCFYAYAIANPSMVFRPEGVFEIDQYGTILLDLRVKINGKKFAKVNKHEALRMIAQLMLDSIPNYLFHRTDFDGQKFYQDILPIITPIADGIRTFQEEEFPL